MKVGTDGVLLGAWAEGGSTILDIGTGTGLLALMMAQRFETAKIIAIDIDHDAYLQAKENTKGSPFKARVEVREKSIQSFVQEQNETGNQFDCIICNPPYFNNSLKAPDLQRTTARHTDTLPHRQLIESVTKLLSHNGHFSCILPTDLVKEFVAEATFSNLSITCRVDVRTTPAKPPKRSLLELRKGYHPTPTTTTVMLQAPDGSRSDWYKKLTADFYLF